MMDKAELEEILRLHRLWLENNKEGKKADFERANLVLETLSGLDLRWANFKLADLSGVDFEGTDLQYANLQSAVLQGANLQGANLDYSCWPLWCGSQGVIIDERIARQLFAHAFNVGLKFWPGGLTEEQRNWLNQFHWIIHGKFDSFK